MGCQRHSPANLPLEKDPVPFVWEAGWAPGPAWADAENSRPRRDSIPGPSSPLRVAIPELFRSTQLQFQGITTFMGIISN